MPSYARRLGLFSGTMSVIGGIIGSGIFLNPAIVAQRVGSAGLTMAVWVLGGAVALIGAFCFGELGFRRPDAGGGYVYLREAFGPLPAFLYAWMLLLAIATGAIAAVAMTFASYTVALFSLPANSALPLAVGAIVLLSMVNYVGVKPGAITQNIFTILKLTALAGLIVAGLFLPGGSGTAPVPSVTTPSGSLGVTLAVGAALVPILFSYGGWQQTNFIAAEIIEPERNLPRALVLGVVVVVAVYLLANLAYLRALGAGGLAASTAPASDVMRALVGEAGARFITAGIVVSTFGFLNLVILVSPRVYQTMAADGLFFERLARLHPVYRTPAAAILFQGAWAILLTCIGKYGQLLDYVVFGDWIFFGLAVAALFVYRTRDRRAGVPSHPPGAFRTPGYPLTPALFMGAAIYVVAGSVTSNPGNAVKGTLLLGFGVPVFLFWSRKARKPEEPLRGNDEAIIS